MKLRFTSFNLLCLYFLISLSHFSLAFRHSNRRLSTQCLTRRKEIIVLNVIDQIDPNSAVFVDSLSNGNILKDVSDGFMQTFSARFIGTIIGNIAAFFALKFITDFLWKKAREKYDEATRPVFNKSSSNQSSNSVESSSSSSRSNNPDLPIPTNAWLTLLFCIIIDFAGDASFALPGIGELEDSVWAPLSAYLVANTFGSSAITALDFLKEVLPGTDIIPVATLAWIIKYKFPYSEAAKFLKLSPEDSNSNNNNDNNNNDSSRKGPPVVDVEVLSELMKAREKVDK